MWVIDFGQKSTLRRNKWEIPSEVHVDIENAALVWTLGRHTKTTQQVQNIGGIHERIRINDEAESSCEDRWRRSLYIAVAPLRLNDERE
jgi:hypothetical protein